MSHSHEAQRSHNQGHDHQGHHHGDLKGTKLGISILLNILITVAQVIGGLLSGSLALLSDALHNFSDVIALIISYIADKLTKRRYTASQTFGYKRAEIIAALVNAGSLIAIAIGLAREAILRFNTPVEIESNVVILLAGLSILVNGGSVLLLKKESENNMNMKSAYLHLFSDMVSSVAVLAGGFAMLFWQIYWIDSVLSLLISAYLIYSSFGLLSKTLKVLMQFSPSGLDVQSVEKTFKEEPQVQGIHHLHVWQLNDTEIHLEAHIDLKDDLPISQVSQIMEELTKKIKEAFQITHTTLQPEFGVHDDKKLVVDGC